MQESIHDAVTSVLPRIYGERLQQLVQHLMVVVGIEEVEDLPYSLYVQEDDVKDICTCMYIPCQCRKLLDAFQKRGL